MPNRFRAIIISCALALFTLESCADNKPKDGTVGADTSGRATGVKTIADYPRLATEICDCITNLENALSSRTKNMIIDAGSAADPGKKLEEALGSVEDSMDRAALDQEMRGVDDPAIDDCLRRIEQNHKIKLKTKDQSVRNALAEALEDECSEFSAALLRLGFKTK